MTLRAIPLLCAGLFLFGCSRGNIQNEAAVRQGVIDYLSTRSDLNMSQMQVDVTSVAFRQNEADATVSFRPKGAAAAASGMSMSYTLERKGNRWVVKGRGAGPHQQMQPQPGAGMPPHGTQPGAGQLPPGHPQMNPGAKPEPQK